MALALLTSSLGVQAGNILIINGSSATSEPGTTSSITTQLSTLHVAAGNTVTVVDAVPGSFAGYNQVWDIRFSNSSPITAGVQTQYLGYLSGGGGMFVMGENSGFATRNTSVLALIDAAGGGTLGFTTPLSTQTVLAPFTGPNAVATITYLAPGGVGTNAPGTGDFITVDANGNGTGLAFSVGDLANAPAGALTAIFDVNFMQTNADANSQNLTKNLINFIDVQVPPRVPDGGSAMLMLLGSIAALAYFRRK